MAEDSTERTLSRNLLPEIVARSLADARRDIPRLDDEDAVVSIGSPKAPRPPGLNPDSPLHLRLQFDDVVSDGSRLGGDPTHPPRPGHIRTLLDRAELLLAAPMVYCHCAAGISRSTAAAFILRCLTLAPGEETEAMQAVLDDNPFATPNRLMVKHADTLLERDGAMLAAVEKITRSF